MRHSLLAVLVLLAISSPGLAEEDQPAAQEVSEGEQPFRGPPQEAKIRLEAYQRVKLRADLDKGDASLAVYRSGLSGSFGRFFGYIRLGFGVSGERSVYDLARGESINSPPDPPTAGEPWNVLSFVRLNMTVLVPFGRSAWSLFAFGGARFGWEDGTKLEDGLSGTFGVTIGYEVDETLTLQAGFLLITRIEESPLSVPIVGLRWKPSDWLRVETRGPGIEIGIAPTETVELVLGARYDNRQFRLEDRRRFLGGGIVEDQEVVVELAATFGPVEWLSLRGLVGVVAYQEFDVRDRDGDTLYRSRTEPAPYFELALALLF